MEKILEKIIDLKKLRNIPQFFFSDAIGHQSMLQVRRSVLEFKSNNKEVKEIDFIINSPGGDPGDAYRIIRTLRNNFETVNIVIPFWAKSAATLLSLGGSRIIMDEFGEMGPLDIQIGRENDEGEFKSESALNDEYSLKMIEERSKQLFESMFVNLYRSKNVRIRKNDLSQQLLAFTSEFYRPLLQQIDPYKLGEKSRKLEIGRQYAIRILNEYSTQIGTREIRSLVYYLVEDCPEHGYVVDLSVVSKFLKNVHNSIIFGEEYTKGLTGLSDVLINNMLNDETKSFVGFVTENAESKEEINDTQEKE